MMKLKSKKSLIFRYLKSALCFVLICCTLISFISCRTISASELSDGYERKVSIGNELSTDAGRIISEFGLSVFQNTALNDGQNHLFSPLSAIVCLALMANGASGETLEQIETTLGCDINTLNEALLTYSSELIYKDSPVSLANSIWIKDTGAFKINEDFLQKNADYFAAEIYSAPFDSTTLKDINRWCDDKTDGMIRKIIDSIDPSAVTYMMNALAFESEWMNKYKNNDIIKSYSFTNYDKSESDTIALRSTENIFIEDENAIGFVKYYKDEKFSFAAILPEENIDIYDYISTLDAKHWNELWNGKTHSTVNVILPEFKYDREINLQETLETLGITDMFSPLAADFSKLGSSSDGNIYCGLFKQKTFIQVDRMGTKAAAVTIGSNKTTSEAPIEEKYVYLNRPFVYAIVDNDTGIPIFIGYTAYLG